VSTTTIGIIHRARSVLPIVHPPIEDGAVAVAGGRIVCVGRFEEIRKDLSDFAVEDQGEAALLPGLVNAHTHLDNSGDFVAWAEAFLAAKDSVTEQAKREAIERACNELVRCGTIAVGDICPTLLSPPYMLRQPLWGTVFIEVTGVGRERGERVLAEAREKLSFAENSFNGSRLAFSIAPHATYSTNADVIKRIFDENAAAARLTSFHLAESPQEMAFLSGEDDYFERAIRKWGSWEEGFRPPKTRPLDYLESLGGLALGGGIILVHCVHLVCGEFERIANAGCSVCVCPRSNDYIGVGQPRVGPMLAAGIEPCMGTDGLGSVDSLSLFDEIAFIRGKFPSLEPTDLLHMATLNGARALRLDDKLGSLAPGKIARFLAYRGDIGGEPLEVLTSGIDHDQLSWIDGDQR
jgi:cytosine/adenosine deaminase-related metal-dependent hydrolase